MDTQTDGLTPSPKKTTKVNQHFDKLGTELFPGDYVHVPHGYGNSKSIIAQIIKLNPKMLTIKGIGARYTSNVYSSEAVKLDPALVSMYILRTKG